MVKSLFLARSILFACAAASAASGSMVRYRVDFNATWSQPSHPNAYPSFAHFSSLIGGVHSDRVSFWSPGGISSRGIEQMAETGSTSQLTNEVQTAINAATAASVIRGSGISSPGDTQVTFEVSSEFPLVTLVSMVAPSPDWFVGVHGLDLREGSGWKDQVSIDLLAYDAGSDNGVSFTSPDIDAIPRLPITVLGTPFTAVDPPLGTFTFTRLTVPEPSTIGSVLIAALFVARRKTIAAKESC